MKLSQWLYKKLMDIQTKRALLKMPHVCEDCGNIDGVIRRMSVLYLIFYILAGVAIGYYVKWWLGLIAVYVLCYFDIKRSKPQCKKCLSEKVRLATKEERESVEANVTHEHHE